MNEELEGQTQAFSTSDTWNLFGPEVVVLVEPGMSACHVREIAGYFFDVYISLPFLHRAGQARQAR